jgi:fumarate reductase iron-sulfur subunit
MQIAIKRGNDFVTFELNASEITLLEALEFIKEQKDATLSYSSGCRSSICGSCAVRVNGKEELACAYKLKEGDRVEPLNNSEVLRDLVVNMDTSYATNARSKAWMSEYNKEAKLTHEDESINALQSDCILCGSCYSACPVFAVNGEFLGPFALTRVWKYVSDKREAEPKSKIDTIQTNGVWDCTLCDACTLVCPQGISSKADIEKLRAKSSQYGYMDPNFGNFSGGFDGGFGDGSPSF